MSNLYFNMDKKKVEKEAKQMLDNFAKALSKVKTKEEDYHVDRDKSERVEGGDSCEGFKSKLLGNAPEKDDDFIIAEKGAWK
jgi:predicted Asp-tRNA(Asn)/Glu-tRNA(Gln) amidotransferase subunit C